MDHANLEDMRQSGDMFKLRKILTRFISVPRKQLQNKGNWPMSNSASIYQYFIGC